MLLIVNQTIWTNVWDLLFYNLSRTICLIYFFQVDSHVGLCQRSFLYLLEPREIPDVINS